MFLAKIEKGLKLLSSGKFKNVVELVNLHCRTIFGAKNCTLQTQKHYVYACIYALMQLERQNKRSLYEAKKYFQQKFIGIKHNGNKALKLLAA